MEVIPRQWNLNYHEYFVLDSLNICPLTLLWLTCNFRWISIYLPVAFEEFGCPHTKYRLSAENPTGTWAGKFCCEYMGLLDGDEENAGAHPNAGFTLENSPSLWERSATLINRRSVVIFILVVGKVSTGAHTFSLSGKVKISGFPLNKNLMNHFFAILLGMCSIKSETERIV